MKRLSPYILSVRRGPDGVMWKESDYHKQKELEKKNKIFKRGVNYGRTDFPRVATKDATIKEKIHQKPF